MLTTKFLSRAAGHILTFSLRLGFWVSWLNAFRLPLCYPSPTATHAVIAWDLWQIVVKNWQLCFSSTQDSELSLSPRILIGILSSFFPFPLLALEPNHWTTENYLFFFKLNKTKLRESYFKASFWNT